MSIETLKMSGFRNYKEKSLEFGPGVNVIWGENGSGKTSTLEAIHILSVGKSFRTPRLQEAIEESSLHARLVGVFVSEKNKKEITVSHSKDKRKKITINKAEVSPAEIFGQNPIVLLSPEEQKITNGTPSDRRKYFDKIVFISKQNESAFKKSRMNLHHRIVLNDHAYLTWGGGVNSFFPRRTFRTARCKGRYFDDINPRSIFNVTYKKFGKGERKWKYHRIMKFVSDFEKIIK